MGRKTYTRNVDPHPARVFFCVLALVTHKLWLEFEHILWILPLLLLSLWGMSKLSRFNFHLSPWMVNVVSSAAVVAALNGFFSPGSLPVMIGILLICQAVLMLNAPHSQTCKLVGFGWERKGSLFWAVQLSYLAGSLVLVAQESWNLHWFAMLFLVWWLLDIFLFIPPNTTLRDNFRH